MNTGVGIAWGTRGSWVKGVKWGKIGTFVIAKSIKYNKKKKRIQSQGTQIQVEIYLVGHRDRSKL